MRFLILHLVVIGAFVSAKKQDGDEIRLWSARLRSLVKDCPSSPLDTSGKKDFLQTLRRCMQHRALSTLDALFDSDVIPIMNGMNLVRFKMDTVENITSANSNGNETFGGRNGKDVGWREVVFGRLAQVFRTHVVKIDFDEMSHLDDEDEEEQGRRRRRRQMMPIMMMGLLLMGSVLIPMGFQFLAVLGGKALLLAKMALMLSSIQGLKKIATSGVNYGLYHAPSEQWHDRSDAESLVPPPQHYQPHYHQM